MCELFKFFDLSVSSVKTNWQQVQQQTTANDSAV